MIIVLFIYTVPNAHANKLHFIAGVYSGYIAHELGHVACATIYNSKYRVNFINGKTQVRNENDIHDRNITLGGFGAQFLLTEAIMSSSKRNSYTDGILFWNMIEPLSYIIRHEVFNTREGDLHLIDKYDNSRHLKVEHIEGILISHVIFTYFRLKYNLDTSPFISRTTDGLIFGIKTKF